MRRGIRALCGLAASFTDVAALSLVMQAASIGGNRGAVAFRIEIWFAFALAAVVWNQFLLRRGTQIPALVLWNGGFYAAALVVLIRTALVLEGPLGWILAIGLPAVSSGRAFYHAWSPPALSAQLLRVDGALACGACLLLLREGTGAKDLLWVIPPLVALNVVCAVALRVCPEEGKGTVLWGAPLRGALFSGGLAAALAVLVLGLTRWLGGGSRAAVSAFFQGIKYLWLTFWGTVDRFFGWLAGLFPQEGSVELPPPETAPSSVPVPELSGEAMAPMLPLFAALLAIAAAAVLVVLAVRLRRVRLRVQAQSVPWASGPVIRLRKAGLLRRRWAAFWAELRFCLMARRYANTPAGLLVWLERWGRRHKEPRRPGETIRAYLRRLDGSGGLDALAGALEAQFYGPCDGGLTGQQCRRLRRSFRRNKRAALSRL